MPSTFSIPVRVYIEDTDAGGIVFYVNYLKYMERSRTEFMRSLGYDKPAVMDDGALLVVHTAQVMYKKPALLDDALTVSVSLRELARSYVVFEQTVCRAGELLCTADIKVACVKQGSMRPTAMPLAMRESMLPFVGDNEK